MSTTTDFLYSHAMGKSVLQMSTLTQFPVLNRLLLFISPKLLPVLFPLLLHLTFNSVQATFEYLFKYIHVET